jgi:hypothetical protein
MRYYKNKELGRLFVDVVYIRAKSNPNENYYFECTKEEVMHSIKKGDVQHISSLFAYNDSFIRSSNHV